MTTNETVFVTHPIPVDTTGVRDPGVQSLIMLATSLGWNVLKKHNTPAVITARDGVQKRLPTDTSIRMSVFQTALSTIIVHSGDTQPTIELIDEIIKVTKPSVDHQRRLRLAVGETPAQHRQRLENDRSASHREEDLTQRIGVIFDEAVAAVETYGEILISGEGTPEPQDWELEAALREGLMVPPPAAADNEEHGELISREVFVAHYSGAGNKGGGYAYPSKTSFERIWEDGYIDYECQVCGKAFSTSRGVGGHRQTHIKAGEIEADTDAWRTRGIGWDPGHTTAPRQVDAPASSVAAAPPPTDPIDALNENLDAVGEAVKRTGDAERAILDQIVELVLPEVQAASNRVIAALIQERDEARKKLAELEGEFDALVEMLDSRRRDRS